jgi:amino acid adenylation domain-containing protein
MEKEVIEGLRLSPQQKRLWTSQQSDEAQPYRAQCLLRIDGGLEIATLLTAVARVVEQQEILRTTFRYLPGMTLPLQVINEGTQALVNVYDWVTWGQDQQEARLGSLFMEMQATRFDLEYGPLLLATLIIMSSVRSVLLLCLPSMNSDALGLRNLVKEITLHYSAVLKHEYLAAPAMQYADSSEWHNELLEAPDREEGRAYWREQDFAAIQLLDLPGKIRRSDDTKFKPQIVTRKIASNRILEGERRARKHDVSLSIFLLACWQIILWRLTSSEHIVVGAATDGREHEQLKTALGLFSKYLPAKCHLNESLRFTELLEQLRRSIGENAEYQEYFKWDQSETSAAPPFFPFCFDYAEQAGSYVVDQVAFTIEKEYVCTERFHVRLSCLRTADGLATKFHYDSTLYQDADITRLAAEFQTLIESVVNNYQDVTVGELEIVGEAERRQLLVEWNDTATAGLSSDCIHQVFERQALQNPAAVALVYEGQQWTYAELNERANQLAGHLQWLGVKAEVRVALCVERSLEMIVGVLGILKAGGAYVPLDPTYPRERLRFMLADTEAPVLLTKRHLLETLPPHQAQVVCLDTQWDEIAQASGDNGTTSMQPQNLAYVIYTSGSTGNPKGVLVTHQNVVHSTAARSAFYGASPRRFLLLSSFAFDSSVAGIFWTLCGGGTLVLPVEGLQRDVHALLRVIRQQAVSHLLCLPTLYSMLLELARDGELSELKVVIVAGEACPAELVEQHFALLAQTRLYNEYGPTEASVWSTVHECVPVADERSVPIGKVISNAQAYILDERLRPAATGVAGEMYLGGSGITRGYLHQAEITAEKFIPNLFSQEAGTRLYRTGDIGRFLADGKIEFLGRTDSQVKIRGYRIELGEIETMLGAHPAVETSVALARAVGAADLKIVAYVVERAGATATSEELSSYLGAGLPQYMLPTWIVILDEMPLMANGKIDRQALPDPERLALKSEFNPPRTLVEEALAGIWSEVLAVQELSVTASFFELGGHSLLATQVISRVRETFNVELPVRILFGAPTVRGLAAAIAEQLLAGHNMAAPPIHRASREALLPLSYAQQRLWFVDQLNPGNSYFNVVSALRLTGALDSGALERTLSEIISRHEVLRTSFPSKNGKPVQMIAPGVDFRLVITDLSSREPDERETEARRLVLAEAQLPFDLAKGPLVRASLLRLGEEENIVILTMHHIVSDEWSKKVLISEVVALYETFRTGGKSPLAELPIQYADYAVWQREWLSGEVLQRQLSYWEKQLKGAPAVLELPLDRPRPAVQSFQGGRQRVDFPPRMSVKLKELNRRVGGTLFMSLLAAFDMLLHYHSKQNDIVMGANVANRNRSESEGLIGFFVNTVVIRVDLSGDPSFEELLKNVREVCLEAYAHQDVPFEKVVALLQPERDPSRQPLFQVKLELDNDLIGGLVLPGLKLDAVELGGDIGRYDLQLLVTETRERLLGSIVYDQSLFDEATAARMSKHLEILLQKIVEQPDLRLSELEAMLVESDRQYKLATEKNYRNSIHQRFKQVKKEPQVTAS